MIHNGKSNKRCSCGWFIGKNGICKRCHKDTAPSAVDIIKWRRLVEGMEPVAFEMNGSYQKGAVINHTTFGVGAVISISPQHTTHHRAMDVLFECGVKRLVMEYEGVQVITNHHKVLEQIRMRLKKEEEDDKKAKARATADRAKGKEKNLSGRHWYWYKQLKKDLSGRHWYWCQHYYEERSNVCTAMN